MFMGAIMDAASGNKAIKKIAKRRLDMSRANVASYSALLNGPQQLAQFQEATDLSATLAEMHSAREREKEAAAENEERREQRKSERELTKKTKKKKRK
jgi:glycerol dehydrogenase-like iron-containing ADH family enzyme